jgi:hypothetical protein
MHHPLRPRRQARHQFLGQVAGLRMVVGGGHVRQLRHLLAHGRQHAGVRVADAHAHVLRHAVHVAPALLVPQVLGLPALPDHGLVVGHEAGQRGRQEAPAALDDGRLVPIQRQRLHRVLDRVAR